MQESVKVKKGKVMSIIFIWAVLLILCQNACAALNDSDISNMFKKIDTTLFKVENGFNDSCSDQGACHKDIKDGINELQNESKTMLSNLATLANQINRLETVVHTCSPTQDCPDVKKDIDRIQSDITTITNGIDSLANAVKKFDDGGDKACCADIKKDIAEIQASIKKIAHEIHCMQKALAACCSNQEQCCLEVSQIKGAIAALKKQLTACCDAQATCCTTLTGLLNTVISMLQTIENIISGCCTGGGNSCTGPCFLITQADIPLTIYQSGTWVLIEDVTFSLATTATRSGKRPQASESSLKNNKQTFDAAFAITLAAGPVFLNLNNHSVTINGANVGAVSTLDSSTSPIISGGIIIGDNSEGQFGIALASTAASVSNVAIASVAGAAAATAAAAAVAAPASAAAAVAVAATAAAADPQTSIQLDPPQNTASGILIENLVITDSLNGLSLAGYTTNLTVRNVRINRSIQMGITQPSRSGFHGNYLFQNVSIANSGINGIYTTFNQDNWSFDNCQIRNSVLNGAIFEGTQNLVFKNSQISESGAKGLVVSIRQSQNVVLSDVEIFNSSDENLRVDNVQNLTVTGCSFINYMPTSLPVVKIQDVNNGSVSNCKIMSAAGLADGLFIRNSHGLIIQNNLVKVFNNFSSGTPSPQPPVVTSNALGQFIQTKFCGIRPPNQSGNSTPGSPIGINLQGGVTGTRVSNCVVTGTPTTGIALLPDPLNGTNEGVVIENCLVDGAQTNDVLFSHALNCAIFGSTLVNGQGDGIFIDSFSSQCSVRDTTLTNNRGFGIRNNGINSQIYHNFANANGRNFSAGILQTPPRPGIGSLENISS